jgi:hypothetical protein
MARTTVISRMRFWSRFRCRNRSAIERGCHQARLAADLREGPQRLVSMTNCKVAGQVLHIERLVLTNCVELDRWQQVGVVVLGPAGRGALVEGTSVFYLDSQTGKVVELRRISWEIPKFAARWCLVRRLDGGKIFRIPNGHCMRSLYRLEWHFTVRNERRWTRADLHIRRDA